jgi:hypothetical protein
MNSLFQIWLRQIEQEYRPPTVSERQILDRLLEVNFPGRDSLVQQLEGLLVKQINGEGCLSLNVISTARANLPNGVAVEGRYSDSDAVDSWEPRVNLLLHVVNGLLKLLEVYKDDSSRIRRAPNPEELQLFLNTKQICLPDVT